MKKISTIVMALLMVISLSQCKKNEQNASDNQGETVTITLDVKGASTGSATGGSKVVVNPNTGIVDFENGDQIIVASCGKYVGTLTYDGNLFTGAISNATEGYLLQFYFLGNVTPAETLTSGVTESCSVVISDQAEHLPVISTAPSNENYTASTTDYTAHLLNKCALVKFNMTTNSEAAICVTGFNNKVEVNFMENTLTNSQENNGVITLPAGNGEKWAILLPQEAMESGEQGSAYSQDGVYIGTRGAVPAIVENGYLTTGIQVVVTTEVNQGEVPTGAIDGKFTINANGDQVYFSQGNLQYQASTGIWRFAENQYDYVGNANSNISPIYDGWIDLFGWGTSGWDNGNMYYQPYDTESFWDSQTGYGYGPTNGMNYNYNLTGMYANADWGIYNSINNGGNVPNQWRTLTRYEWGYVFYTRSTPSGIRFVKGNVNGMNGVILLPDNWNSSVQVLNYTNNPEAPYTTNTFTLADWEAMEANGAAFLPAVGHRVGTSVNYVGNQGNYWSASYGSRDDAYYVYFYNGGLSTDISGGLYHFRYYGHSVRLVHDIQ
jgi:hypothetical protein